METFEVHAHADGSEQLQRGWSRGTCWVSSCRLLQEAA